MSDATDRVVETYTRLGGNVLKTAKELGLSRGTIYHHLNKSGAMAKPVAAGRLKPLPNEKRPKPKSGKVHRYLLTSAQNNTYVADEWWANLLALKEEYSAELLVGTFSYNMNAYGELAVKKGTKGEYQRELWFDDRLKPYIAAGDNRNIELAPGLVWVGRGNILPTAAHPLLGFEGYTGRASGIYPHAKQEMESVASHKAEATKFNFTTGCVTQRNYLQKKAGLKAEHEHVYGAMLVEVCEDGRWYVRPICQGEDGSAYDMTLRAKDGKVTDGHRVEAINWGDVHTATLEPDVKELAFGKGGMLDTLKPRYQFFHDSLDFKARNPHTMNKGLHRDRYLAYVEGFDSVEKELMEVADFLSSTRRKWCESIVVASNHDEFFHRWLDTGDHRRDPINARYFLAASKYAWDEMAETKKMPLMLRWAVERVHSGPKANLRFLELDEPFVICKQYNDGIECGMHGDDGPNGSQGSESGFRKMGRRVNAGHRHTASLRQFGVGYAGLLGSLDQGYNSGPGSWSQTQLVTYANGTRSFCTFWKNAWRA